MEGLDWVHLLEWIFKGALTGFCYFIAHYLRDLNSTLKSINVQLEHMATKQSAEEKRVDELTGRVFRLESKPA